jgi:maltose O-acetyltransferase
MRERMLAGEPYLWAGSELEEEYWRRQAVLARFNAGDDVEAELFGAVGEDTAVRRPVRLDYGWNVSIGARTFVNYGAVFLDPAPITIGDECQIATNVQLLTATHPLEPGPRREGWESAHPIVLEDGVWLGGGVIVCPGVTIGENTAVGAGAVVTKDLPAGVLAVGTPARIVREL